MTFHEHLDNYMIVFIDDTLIYSWSREEYAEHLWIVLGKLGEKKLFASWVSLVSSKEKKMDFWVMWFQKQELLSIQKNKINIKTTTIPEWLILKR